MFPTRDRTFFRHVLFSDEATFHNTGYYWSIKIYIGTDKLIINISGVLSYGRVNEYLIGSYFFN